MLFFSSCHYKSFNFTLAALLFIGPPHQNQACHWRSFLVTGRFSTNSTNKLLCSVKLEKSPLFSFPIDQPIFGGGLPFLRLEEKCQCQQVNFDAAIRQLALLQFIQSCLPRSPLYMYFNYAGKSILKYMRKSPQVWPKIISNSVHAGYSEIKTYGSSCFKVPQMHMILRRNY